MEDVSVVPGVGDPAVFDLVVDLEPEGEFVLLDPYPVREKFIGTDFHAETGAKPFPFTEGVVLKIGKGVKSPEFEVGDVVVSRTYPGAPIQVDGRQFLSVPYKELLFKWDGPRPE
jgi:hypothetical protein